MINSKNELKRKLAENKDGIKFKTIENHCGMHEIYHQQQESY